MKSKFKPAMRYAVQFARVVAMATVASATVSLLLGLLLRKFLNVDKELVHVVVSGTSVAIACTTIVWDTRTKQKLK